MSGSQPEIESLAEKILNYKGKFSVPMINRITKDYIRELIEEKDEIQLIQKNFREFNAKGADIIDFVRIFLNILSHEQDETLYLAISLIDLFKDICETYNLKNLVKSQDILNYVVDVSFHITK
jgi:hypothetical protein